MYYFSAYQYAQIQDAFDNSTSGYPEADRYAKIFEIIQEPDAFGNLAANNVIAWFGAAAQANRGIGGASDFIRDYTRIQLEIRTGETVAGIEGILQSASNEIADAVFGNITANLTTIDGQTYYALPTAHEIGVNDATVALSSLAAFDSDPGIWSGNPLFLGLGDASFWNQNIIDDDRNTYDLFVTRVAFTEAGFSLDSSGISDLSNLFFGQGFSGFLNAASTVSGAYADSLDFIGTAYGGAASSVFGSNPELLVFADMVIGSTGNDTGLVPDYSPFHHDNDFIHGGAGSDTIFATLGRDMIDGGSGLDTVSFELLDTVSSRVTLSNHNSAVPFSASIVVGDEDNNDTTVLFDVEDLILGNGDDILEVHSLTHLQSIDAGDNTEDGGDTINLSAVSTTSDINLQGNTLTVDGNSMAVLNFENVVGTDSNDTITGNSVNNILYGGEGADSLSGGAGDDFIILDAADTLVDGGAGRDVGIVTGEAGVTVDLAATGLEVVVGGAGADNFTLNGNGDTLQMAAGGGGVDTFTFNTGETAASNGPVVVWGGDGADVFRINDGQPPGYATYSHGILTVNAEGLTADNFADFNLDQLGLGASFDWDAIDMVVLNPDSSDEFYVNGDRVGVEAGTVSVSQTDLDGVNHLVGSQNMELISGGPSNYAQAVGMFGVEFLNNGVISVQSSVVVDTNSIMQPIDPDTGDPYLREDFIIDSTWDDFNLPSADFSRNFDFYLGDMDLAFETTDSIGHYWIRFEFAGSPFHDFFGATVNSIGGVGVFEEFEWLTSPWFVVGGAFGGQNLSADNTISVTMPAEPTFSLTDWLASVSSPPGGTGETPPNNTDVTSGSGETTVSTFTAQTSFLIYDGSAVDPADSAAGYSVTQVGADVEIDFGSGDVVILENVLLADWLTASALQHFGSAADDTLTGTSQNEAFASGAGNDTINAGAGDDTLYGGTGNDVLWGEDGEDTLNGGSGADWLLGGIGNDNLEGGGENDNLRGEAGNDVLYGDDGDDNLRGGSGDDTLYGGAGADTLLGGTDTDVLYGGDGNDDLQGENGNDVLWGEGGDDSLSGGSGVDWLLGGIGNDTLYGGVGNDNLRGEAGNDVLYGQDDNDNLRGGTGSDWLFGDSGDDSLYGESGNDYLRGGDGNDVLYGGVGNDDIRAGSGNDTLVGDVGNDTLRGGSGNDTFVFASNSGSDTISDFNRAADTIQFVGTGLSFAALTISYSGGNAVVDYGTGSIALTGISSGLDASDFVF